MVAGLTALALVAVDRRRGGAAWLRGLRAGWGVPLMLAVVLPWFVAIGLATHGAFFADALGGDLAGKVRGGDDAHGAPPGLHLLLLPLLAFPSSLLVLRALPAAWRDRTAPATRFLLAWIVPSWIVFECVPTKLPHYTLPLYPALFLLAAAWVLDPARRPPPRWMERVSVVAFVGAAAVLGAGAAALPFLVRPGLGASRSAWGCRRWLPWSRRRGSCCAWSGRGAIRGRRWRARRGGAGVLVGAGDRAAEPVRALDRAARGGGPCGALAERPTAGRGVRRGGLPRAEPRVPRGHGHAPACRRDGTPRGFCPGTRKLWSRSGTATWRRSARESARVGLAPREIGAVEGYNYSRGRRTALTLFTGGR